MICVSCLWARCTFGVLPCHVEWDMLLQCLPFLALGRLCLVAGPFGVCGPVTPVGLLTYTMRPRASQAQCTRAHLDQP